MLYDREACSLEIILNSINVYMRDGEATIEVMNYQLGGAITRMI